MVTSASNGTCTRGSYDHASQFTPAQLYQENEASNKFYQTLSMVTSASNGTCTRGSYDHASHSRRRNFTMKMKQVINFIRLCQWSQVPAMALVLADHTITRVNSRRRNFTKKVEKEIINLIHPLIFSDTFLSSQEQTDGIRFGQSAPGCTEKCFHP